MNHETLESKSAESKRIASLDFARGLAIFLMTFFHSFSHVFDHSWFLEDSDKLFDYPKIVLIPLVILLYLGSWNSFFLLISCCVNTLGMIRGANRKANLEQMLIKRLVTGIFLLAIDIFTEGVLYNGYFGTAIVSKDWGNFNPFLDSFYKIKTLQIIGWSIIVTSIIIYFLLRKDGHERFRRNIIIVGLLTLAVFISTPVIHNLVDNMPWVVPEGLQGWPEVEVQTHNASFKTWLMVIVAGNVEPLFPYLATGLVGSMLGLSLGREKPTKVLAKRWFYVSLLLIASGISLFLMGLPMSISLRPTLPSYLIQLGGQLGLIILLIYLVEYKNKGKEFADKKIVRFFRRWGMVALTIYTLEIYDLVPGTFLNLMLGKATQVNFLENVFGFDKIYLAMIVGIHSMIWYEVLIRLWSKINFKWSMEWMLLKIQYSFSKQKSRRLDVNYVLHNVEWMSLKEPSEKESAIVKMKYK